MHRYDDFIVLAWNYALFLFPGYTFRITAFPSCTDIKKLTKKLPYGFSADSAMAEILTCLAFTNYVQLMQLTCSSHTIQALH